MVTTMEVDENGDLELPPRPRRRLRLRSCLGQRHQAMADLVPVELDLSRLVA